ncbi:MULTISPECIES: efflux transporter outer membrane subunit [unclassified Sphingomonas]|uniref:efflux transporter outer membrane subunit n=1 Tax=unclassified Sphingomonas TaxID=196159 RepID=UPI0006FE474D|nr:MULTISPECIES: efflux transporter outer membrane subunit [unclassified Sphingomonas]KQX25723.1 RND transporter [Sphingomonas sp. Root1294]KQY66712.1 RND transporter [Sphingomonas sp. Root50]KRB90414.1 RND transporter [Sphingomonas sp. Root720]
MRGERGAAALALVLLAGCSMAPAYRPPQTVVPQGFKEVEGWTAARPMDAAARGEWWKAFDDPVLDDLIARAAQASPTLEAALARYGQARAAARIEAADLFPRIDAAADAGRQRLSGNRFNGTGVAPTYDQYTVGATLDYELDLWGRIRNSARAARADAEASGDDLASARLSLQTAVADAYARLRGLDAEAELLRQTVDAFGRAYELTAKRHDGGIVSGIDVNRARTVLDNARAQISAIANQRAATEHEIAALVGAVASDFAIPVRSQPLLSPTVPAGAPSELLQRRPDVAAAERRMFAANARIGVARAAFFPTLTLGLGGGYQTTHGDLFATPNSFWGLGPASAVLALFDGGRRKAQVRMSRAEYDALAADYRGTVLTAFREVEDALAADHHLADQIARQRSAAAAAGRTSQLALTRYRDGAADYLEVVTAQTDALDAQRALLSAETQRMRASVALVRALGGSA